VATSRRRNRKPFTLEDAQRHLSDLMWLLTHTIHQRDDVDLGELCRATHAFAQAASVLKALQEVDVLSEVESLRDRVHALESQDGALRA